MGSPPDILTMSTLSLLSLLTTVTISVAQSEDCWYGSICPYNRDSPNQFPIIDPLQDTKLQIVNTSQSTQLGVVLPVIFLPPAWILVTVTPVSRMVSVTVVPGIVQLTTPVPC